MDMSILVTGCAGFIGFHTCKSLLSLGCTVYGIDNMDPYYDIGIKQSNIAILRGNKNFHFIEEDILHSTAITTIKPCKVLHLAGMSGVAYSLSNPETYTKVNITGFTHVLEECRKAQVSLLVYASSSSVYGISKEDALPSTETSVDLNTCTALSPYACSKLAMEIFAKTYNAIYGLKVIGLRFFTVYGPRGRPDMAPYKIMKAISAGTPFIKYGDGRSSRDYTYIDDIVSGILLALNNNKAECEVYNLGAGQPVTLNDFISYCETICGKRAIYEQKAERLGDVPHTHANIEKAKAELQYNPVCDIYKGLGLLYQYLSDEN